MLLLWCPLRTLRRMALCWTTFQPCPQFIRASDIYRIMQCHMVYFSYPKIYKSIEFEWSSPKLHMRSIFPTRDDLNNSFPYLIFMFGNEITIFIDVRGNVIFFETEQKFLLICKCNAESCLWIILYTNMVWCR